MGSKQIKGYLHEWTCDAKCGARETRWISSADYRTGGSAGPGMPSEWATVAVLEDNGDVNLFGCLCSGCAPLFVGGAGWAITTCPTWSWWKEGLGQDPSAELSEQVKELLYAEDAAYRAESAAMAERRDIQTLQTVAQCVVQSVEQSRPSLPKVSKMSLAMGLVLELLDGLKVTASDCLVETAIEAAMLTYARVTA